ncbi:hypothetical protein [uncultured Draconibacterium sp.]|uniref:hypothetical protein n=1 Tax=uncultured Draconibacterium sp. TaxID=1573823 RepID=UPI0032164FFB
MKNFNPTKTRIIQAKLMLAFLFIAQTFFVNGQSLIVNDTTYKPGIYKNFEEFKFNNPSIDFSYQISTKTRNYGFFNYGNGFPQNVTKGKVSYYRISINRKTANSIGSVYGFSDGKNVYINPNNPVLGPKTEFTKIEYFGDYCYFKDTFCQLIDYGETARTVCSLTKKLLNIENGEVLLLDERLDLVEKDKKLKAYLLQDLKAKK